MSGTDGNSGSARGKSCWFGTTHWSVVLSAGDDASPGAKDALEKLCEAYWYPLYAYVRRQGRSPEDAQDLTQAFFASLLQKNTLRHAQRERGRFRSFLLTSLQNFLIHEWEKANAAKRGGGSSPLPWDQMSAEAQYKLEATADPSPDKAFERRWAMTLFQQALTRLHAEFTAAGKAETFNELKGFLSEAADESGYAGASARLKMAPGAAAVAVHRLRKRYGELVREEIANTVTSPSEIEDEMRHLIELMSG